MLADERLQFCDELGVTAERKVGFDPLLDRTQAELLEPEPLGRRRRSGVELRERLSAPQRERVAQRP